MIYQYPSPQAFDAHWLSHGFCVSNPETTWQNSHSLSFYADTILALIIGYLTTTQPKNCPRFQKHLLKGAVMAVFGHGVGHMYLGLKPGGMDLRFRPHEDLVASIAGAVVTVVAFACIFQGTMPLSSTKRLAFTAIIATAGFTILDIVPKHNFVYAQAAIYISNALHMLTLPAEDKSAAAYALYPYFQLPVLFVGAMESTICEYFLQRFGGHMLFDSSIAVGIILNELSSRRIEAGRAQKIKAS